MATLVSIITPCYNKSRFISETIFSVLNQSYQNIELIIIDDCSTDDSRRIVSDFASKDKRVKLFANPEQKGGSACRNIGIKRASGDLIVFLDADDLLEKDSIRKRVSEMESDTELDFCVFSMGVFDKTPGDREGLWKPNSKNPLTDFLRHDLPWSIVQPIWRKKLVARVNGFDEQFPRFQDVEFHARIMMLKGLKYIQFDSICDCYYRISDERRLYNVFLFNQKRVEASLLYFNNFYQTALSLKKKNLVFGSIYETYVQIIYHTRTGKMSLPQFNSLKSQLLDETKLMGYDWLRKLFFKASFLYHFYLPRIPGINFLFKKMITL